MLATVEDKKGGDGREERAGSPISSNLIGPYSAALCEALTTTANAV